MRMIIAGSRDLPPGAVVGALQSCTWLSFATAVVSGMARGADQQGVDWAESVGLPVEPYPVPKAVWRRVGPAAGYQRNERMAQHAEGLVAVWDGSSPGTGHMIDLARRYGLLMDVHAWGPGGWTFWRERPTGHPEVVWDAVVERASIFEFDAGFPRRDADWWAGTWGAQMRRLGLL